MKRGLKIEANDTVGIVLESARKGESVVFGDLVVEATSDINMPHKIALQEIKEGEEIFKYGEVIGYATEHISKGDHVHVHNLDSEKLMK